MEVCNLLIFPFLRCLSYLLNILYIIAITAEGMAGALAVGRHKMDLFVMMFIALVAAIGEGSIRDILCMRIQLVFQKEIYTSIAILAGGLYYTLLEFTSLNATLVTFIVLVAGVSARLLAIFYNLSLPISFYEDVPKKEGK